MSTSGLHKDPGQHPWPSSETPHADQALDQLLYVPCSQRVKASWSTRQYGPIRLPGNSPLEIDALTSSASTRNTEAASSAVRTRSSGTGEPGATGVPAVSPGPESGSFPSVADDFTGSGRSAFSAGSVADRVLARAVSLAAASSFPAAGSPSSASSAELPLRSQCIRRTASKTADTVAPQAASAIPTPRTSVARVASQARARPGGSHADTRRRGLFPPLSSVSMARWCRKSRCNGRRQGDLAVPIMGEIPARRLSRWQVPIPPRAAGCCLRRCLPCSWRFTTAARTSRSRISGAAQRADCGGVPDVIG